MRHNRAILATVARVRVLVVEDNHDSREIYENTLRAAGYEVAMAASLAEAQEASRVQKPDLVILDCRLPDGCGIDLLKRWKACPTMGDVPIVMVTAHSVSDYIRAASNAGADAFLVKPCWDDLTAFIARVVQAAGQKSTRRPLPQTTTKRRRYRISTRPQAPLSLVPTPLFDVDATRFVARCGGCFRTSPTLGHSAEEAKANAIALRWAVSVKGWLCPVCVERYPTD